MKSITELFEDWWEDTGSWMDKKNIHKIAKKAFFCGVHAEKEGVCDGRYEDEKIRDDDSRGSGEDSIPSPGDKRRD